MAGAYTEQELLEVHKKLKEKQDSLEPYLTLTIMASTLHFKSINSVVNVVDKLVEMGLVEKVQHGRISKYRIL